MERKRGGEEGRERERERGKEEKEFEGERNAAPWWTSRRSVYRRRPNMYDPLKRFSSNDSLQLLEIAAAAAGIDENDDDEENEDLVATLPAKNRSDISRIRKGRTPVAKTGLFKTAA